MVKEMTKKEMKRLEKKERNKLDKKWREMIKIEFGNKCIVCGSTERLNCHHILPREDKRFRHEPLNGILLCAKHHKWSIEMSPHKNPFAFYHFYGNNLFKERCQKLSELYLSHEQNKQK